MSQAVYIRVSPEKKKKKKKKRQKKTASRTVNPLENPPQPSSAAQGLPLGLSE
jgi:hypothetical protein